MGVSEAFFKNETSSSLDRGPAGAEDAALSDPFEVEGAVEKAPFFFGGKC